MANKSRKGNQISRRGILPILGSALLMPFLGLGSPINKEIINLDEDKKEEEYQTLLKPDGTTVKVKVSTIKKSKIVKQNISNKSFLNWLGKKL
jgi:hypothetical protein